MTLFIIDKNRTSWRTTVLENDSHLLNVESLSSHYLQTEALWRLALNKQTWPHFLRDPPPKPNMRLSRRRHESAFSSHAPIWGTDGKAASECHWGAALCWNALWEKRSQCDSNAIQKTGRKSTNGSPEEWHLLNGIIYLIWLGVMEKFCSLLAQTEAGSEYLRKKPNNNM